MNVGIVGLGLIGGSLAKAYKRSGATVLGADKDKSVLTMAKLSEAIDGELEEPDFSKCDLILIAITPVSAIKWMEENGPKLSQETIVIDCCGTKRMVCKRCFEIAEKYNLKYMGGHPMAGKERGGFKNSRADLYDNQPFILVPRECDDINLLCEVKKVLKVAGFGRVAITTSKEHDQVIAFTSQMPHIVSNGYIKSKTALKESPALSAGSYRDFTRVAYLDENMWAELFIENKDYLGKELRGLIYELERYADAVEDGDEEGLKKLLAEGKKCKTEVEAKCN